MLWTEICIRMGRTQRSTLEKVHGMSCAGVGPQVGLPSTVWEPTEEATGLEGRAGRPEVTVSWIWELTSVTDPLFSHSL